MNMKYINSQNRGLNRTRQPERVIDAFIDNLDMSEVGFQ